MAGFTEGALAKKLMDLNASQQSIQTLSLWLIHHRKHHSTIVKVWFKEMCKGNNNVTNAIFQPFLRQLLIHLPCLKTKFYTSILITCNLSFMQSLLSAPFRG